MGMECQDPEALESCSEVEVFHDESVWVDLSPRPRPSMDPEIARVVRDHELEWDGWLEAFETGNGDVYVTLAELQDLGPEGFDALMEGATGWYDRHAMRTLGGCLGLGVMFAWLAAGWLAGTVWWLLGMAAIAVVTWMIRPRSRPGDLWGPIDTGRFGKALERAAEGFDEAWEPVLLRCGALPVGEEHLRLNVLRRSVRAETLRERFTPDGLAAILLTLAPVEDDE